MSKKVLNFSVDSDVAEAVRPLAKKYGINLSGFVNNSLLMLLQQFEQIEKLASSNPGGVPVDVARAYLDQQISKVAADTESLVDEQFPTQKKSKVKA